jgi:hypothetical protein
MNKFLQKTAIAALLFSGITLSAQNVGINATGAAPDAGALLDVSSTTKGLLIPRVSIANLTLIAPIVGSATTSMLVYNTNAGTGLGYHYWDGADWIRFLSAANVDNGLYFNAGAARIRLGGPLVENTTVTQGSFGMTYNLTGTGTFNIQDGGVNHFQVVANGDSYFGSDVYWRDGSTAGTILARLIDSGDDGILDVYRNGAIQHRLHGDGASVINEQGQAVNDFRIESSGQPNQFFINAGTARIGIRTGAPSWMFHMTNGGVNVGAAPMAAFDNNTAASGVALSATNNGATNGYNAIEGLNSYAGTAFIPAGVFGLAIYSGGVNAPTIGVRGATNEWQGTGVYGSRFNSGGGNTGWGGEFYNDLGYTGFFGAISDERTKKNIKQIDGALGIIDQLNPVTYHFDLEKYPLMGLNTEMEYGFIAQEVRQVLPEITRVKGFDTESCSYTDPAKPKVNKREEFVAMDYTRIIPILTKAVQEQQAMIEAQNQKLEELQNLIKELQQK